MKAKYYVENIYDFDECNEYTKFKLKSEVKRSLIFKHVMFIETGDKLRVLTYQTGYNFTWFKIKSKIVTALSNRRMDKIIKLCKIEDVR